MSAETETTLNQIQDLGARLTQAKTAIATRVVGQDDVVDLALAALLSGGHALIVGLPGLGKTLLVDTLARVTFSRSCR